MTWIPSCSGSRTLLFVIPILLLAKPANRNSPRLIFLSAVSLLLAGSIYRINTYIVGYHPIAGGTWHYFPSVGEIMVTVGIFSLEVMLYLIVVKTLPVLHRAATLANRVAHNRIC